MVALKIYADPITEVVARGADTLLSLTDLVGATDISAASAMLVIAGQVRADRMVFTEGVVLINTDIDAASVFAIAATSDHIAGALGIAIATKISVAGDIHTLRPAEFLVYFLTDDGFTTTIFTALPFRAPISAGPAVI